MRECLRYIGLRCAYSHGVEFCDLLTSRTPSCADLQGNANRITIEEDNERATAILARIEVDGRSLTGRTLEIREERGKKKRE